MSSERRALSDVESSSLGAHSSVLEANPQNLMYGKFPQMQEESCEIWGRAARNVTTVRRVRRTCWIFPAILAGSTVN